METLMHSRKKVYLLITLVLFSTLTVQVWASPTTTVTFSSDGVTVEVTFPEEAHPTDDITHNVTITAHTDLALESFALFIYAPVNSSLLEIKNRTFTWDFLENENLTSRIEFQLPENTNGTLYCVMNFKTDQAPRDSSNLFFTTRVSELTFSEMQTLYNNYETLLANFNDLSNNYTISVEALNLLTTQHAELQKKYNSEIAAYNSLLNSKDQISQEYNNLNANYKAKLTELSASQSDYETLNTTKNNLQTSYTTLQNVYNNLNQKYSNLLAQLSTLQEEANELPISRTLLFIALMAVAGLVALIVYLKRKKPEPYMVIRKETVTVPQDEENPPP